MFSRYFYVAYNGINDIKTREKALNIALDSYNKEGVIDYKKINTELVGNEQEAKKHILDIIEENVLFKIPKEVMVKKSN